MPRVFMYVIARDFGFAPNPFHGYCTLATCKPDIRATAQVQDWVIGMGGRRLKASGRCVFAMKVTDAVSFNDYWFTPAYFDKRPVRNGSNKMMVGDNIYHYHRLSNTWRQADSHHSMPDGTPDSHNVATDTRVDRVLISREFFYFGRQAPIVPRELLDPIGYRNGRYHRVFEISQCAELLSWLRGTHGRLKNLVTADPFDFVHSARRYSARDNKIR